MGKAYYCVVGEFWVVGFGDDEVNRILDYLYSALAKEIQQLKTLMQG